MFLFKFIGADPDPNGPDDDSGGGAGGGGGSNPGNSIKERNCETFINKNFLKQNLSQILSDPNSKIVQQMVDLKFDPEEILTLERTFLNLTQL